MGTSSSSGRSSSLRNSPPEAPYAGLDSSRKEEIARTFAPRIKAVALGLKAKLPGHVELSDLMSAGALGLMEAMGKFRSGPGVRFETFADSRIRGAMLDELRRMDWFSRGLRQKVKKLERTIREFEQVNGQAPSRSELEEITGQNRHDLENTLEALNSQLVLSLEAVQEQGLEPGENQPRNDPATMVLVHDIIDKLVHLIDKLNERERLVLSLYYTEELNMKEVAAALDITEGRVSQLHSQALAKLRKMFRQQHGETI